MHKPVSMWWTGLTGGVTAILCCVGPTVLALTGLMSGAAAFTLATDLYDNWNWAFRLAGLAVMASLVWWALRRRRSCSLNGVKTPENALRTPCSSPPLPTSAYTCSLPGWANV